MAELVCTLAGQRATTARLFVPPVGPWVLDADLDEAATLTGQVECRLGDLDLIGTVDERATSTFAAATRVRVVAGGNGWGRSLPPRGYHNDAGVKASQVAQDAAREVGEGIGTFTPTRRLGNDFARAVGPASRALEEAAGGTPWWVDYLGVTQVQERPSQPVGEVELLSFDASSRVAVLALTDTSAVLPGSTITDERIPGGATVREVHFELARGTLRARCWCGSGARDRLSSALEALVQQVVARSLRLGGGPWRYRVVGMAPDGRVNLQAISTGVPDVLPVPMRPGAAGVHAQLTPGTEVLVHFVEGDPGQPVITHFAGKGGDGWIPESLSLAAGLAPVARLGDTVQVFLPPVMPFSGTIGGNPATGVLTLPSGGVSVGVIGSGNSKVLA